jgi:RimJ/RimL family protein N-acetyltransferase
MEWNVTLRDGTPAHLRTIEPEDRDAIAAGFDELSDESRYRRFLSAVPRLSSSTLRYLTDVDHHHHEAVIAFSHEGEPMGVARYVREDPESDSAEVAVTVVDRWQGRGLGTALLARLTDRAREEGVQRFTATALATNNEMIDLLRNLGVTDSRPASGGVVEMRVALPPDVDEESPLRRALRHAASGGMWVRLLRRGGLG